MQHDILHSMDARELGNRLQEARRVSGFTQQEAADHLEVARTTLTAIEKGERRIRPQELVRLASLYGRSIGELLRPSVTVEAFTVQLRAGAAPPAVTEERVRPAIGEFQRLCEDYLELERLSGASLARRYPPPYRYGHVRAEAAAEDIAVSERNRLGLGDGPLVNLREVLENDVGLRIFYIDLSSSISEMYAYADHLGGCFAVNRKHPEERRRMSLCHGYAHFLTNRYQSEICAGIYERVPAHERFAGAFASAFLMPATGLQRRFHEMSQRRERSVTPADLLTLAHLYFVSVEALTRRLEDLRLLPLGVWERIKLHGFQVGEAQRMLGLPPRQSSDQVLPARYQYLALETFARGTITEGQLARFLRTDRLSARELVDSLTSESIVSQEGLIQPVPIDLDKPLLAGE